MMWTVQILLVLLVNAAFGNEAPSTRNHLTDADRIRLKQVFNTGWSLKDLANVHYAILGYKLLGERIPNEKEVCGYLLEASKAGGAATVENYFYIAGAWKALQSCTGALPIKQLTEKFTEAVEKEPAIVADVYYGALGLKSLGKAPPTNAKLVESLQAALKKDDTITNVAYALHIASEMGQSLGAFALDRIEDAVVQADEVDGKYLQFEGGLTITGLLVSGAFKLGTALGKSPGLMDEQTVKFANYFLSRRSVQTPKGAYTLLNVLNILATNKFQTPVVLNAGPSPYVGVSSPQLTVRVRDVLGRELTGDQMSLTLESAARLKDQVIVMSNVKFVKSATDKSKFSVNVMDSKPDAGVYKAVISVVQGATTGATTTTTGGGGGSKLVGATNIPLVFRVTARPQPESMQIGVADADQTTPPKMHTVVYPTKLGTPLEVDSQQKLVVRFALKDKTNGKPLSVHQAFLRMVRKGAAEQEVIFVVSEASAPAGVQLPSSLVGTYKLDLDIGSKAWELGWVSGKYRVELIIGDVILAQDSFIWELAEVNVKLGPSGGAVGGPLAGSPQDSSLSSFQSTTTSPRLRAAAAVSSLFSLKPEIQHTFREPEKRPPVFVSNLFTSLVLLPILVLLALWFKLGVNISNFPLSITGIGFHLGLAGLFGLFACFWLKLNMFQTLKYLIGLGVVTFLCGNNMLAKISSTRNKQH